MENEENERIKYENEQYDIYKYGQNFGVQFSKDIEKYYDIIIDIDSITKLFKEGWDILYTEEGEKSYKEKKEENLTVVAVIGNKNKGKSYILQKISGNKLPLGYSVSTIGISILYPKNLNQNIILLDSAGFEVPLLEIPGIYEFEIVDQEKKTKYEEELKNINDEIQKTQIDKDFKNFEKNRNLKTELLLKKKSLIKFDDKAVQIAKFKKDRCLTDYFLQKFILCNSDILLCVVGQLTFSDQQLINTIRSQLNNIKKKKLFIIHNLTTFVEKKQVEEYIKDTLMQSYTFDLEQIQIPKFGEKNENENQFYWREKNLNKNDNGTDIIHLVMANDDENSEAGKYYNDSTIEFIKRQINSYVDYKKFDIKESLKNFLIEFLNEILENRLYPEDIIDEENRIRVENKYFKEPKIKNCLIDELGINPFVETTYKPNYRKYKTIENGEKLYIIEIEIPGEIENFSQTLEYKVGCNIITIKGEKKKIKINNKNETNSKEPKSNEEYELVPFELDIKIPLDQVYLDKYLKDRNTKENGIYKLYYSIIENNSDSEDVEIYPENDDEDEDDEDNDDNDNDKDDDEEDDDDKDDDDKDEDAKDEKDDNKDE